MRDFLGAGVVLGMCMCTYKLVVKERGRCISMQRVKGALCA